MSDDSSDHMDLVTSDERTDRIDHGMTASGQRLVEGMTAEGRGMGPTRSAYMAAPAPPPPAPADAASSARPPK